MPAADPTKPFPLTSKAAWHTREINRRCKELTAAFQHHLTYGFDIPAEWAEEWNYLNERLRELKTA